ncbi:5-formyltetrahydrofolate cyclo-ligase [Flammeovirga kamogawensis]|uniref:5-formyltetrahydrofolate cyclo-ligase n=1 Tax=Flammeovirga kamogawensis TaxID=373891 RepID=A0ABX8GUX4_9BACT|nr:5-formyltetrahydrofolate cyclo-ligase [Flammeovirga kamogawensis]MBB6459738.1 5-formyltetrahydrofolate cyclo-ligase [Flammeovirga kamogawensis]QWG07203.1 5-formyltetrahydrofolate cyclo-ligase [Flammeovirga kamogawensis]TRX69023.1 5-formyltetrahydrofolate cyclo-ligase [Flammeovirga kamogawensis]
MIALKKKLRKEIIAKRNQLTPSEVLLAEEYIAAAFWDQVPQGAAVLHTYLPINKEASTYKIIKKALALGWKVVVPKTLPNRELKHLILHSVEHLREERFGTLIPAIEEEYTGDFDHVLVPGVAFSSNLGRMGYGGGYYDTFLSTKKNTKKWGIGYSFQMNENLPLEEHDVKMDALIIAPVN